MEIKGKVHCLFEQSGTFKNEFKKLGIDAYDYDIQNHFGQTDFVIDLFGEIEKAWGGGASVFDKMTRDDFVFAFFPCIYFTGSTNPCYYTLENINYRSLDLRKKFQAILERADNRNNFYKILYKLCAVVLLRGFRLVIENPYSSLHFLKNNFLKEPSVFDQDRSRRGDFFTKPTGYWFFNCEPTSGSSFQTPKKSLSLGNVNQRPKAGFVPRSGR